MKKTISKILILLTLISVLVVGQVYASSLTLEVKTDKEKVEIGETVTITVDWKE